MITEEQIRTLCNNEHHARTVAILLRDFKSTLRNHVLIKGTLVDIVVSTWWDTSVLYVADEIVHLEFPYDAAELLG